MKYLVSLLPLMLLLILISPIAAEAQCSMCKATVESPENAQLASGLNSGILYLMSVPYVLFGVIAILWYRNSRKNRDKKESIEKRLKNTISRA